MITRWGANIEKDKVLLEYPRPQMRRNSYINLNGMWQYAIVRGESLPDKIDGEILVPFSPECLLSGVRRTVSPEDMLWYVKNFSLPADFNIGRVLLHFGAVDQIAEVYLNGIEVGSHTGGYTPFSMDITRELREENQLIVKVRDVTDTSWHTRGKQKIRKGGIWYTPQSGIWQTVWLESVPEEYISGLHILPLYDEAAVEITVYSDVERPCTARMGLVVAQGETNRPFRMSVQGFTPWSPENPHLYGFDCCFSFQGKFFHFLAINRHREIEYNLLYPASVFSLFREHLNSLDKGFHKLFLFCFRCGMVDFIKCQ